MIACWLACECGIVGSRFKEQPRHGGASFKTDGGELSLVWTLDLLVTHSLQTVLNLTPHQTTSSRPNNHIVLLLV